MSNSCNLMLTGILVRARNTSVFFTIFASGVNQKFTIPGTPGFTVWDFFSTFDHFTLSLLYLLFFRYIMRII